MANKDKKALGKKELTSEQQESLNIFLSNGIKIIHTPETTDELIKQMGVTPNKAEAVGTILANIIKRLEISAEDNGVMLDVEVILVGSAELLQELILIAEGTGGGEGFTVDQIKEAVGHAVGIYLQDQIASGRITKEELAAVGEQWKADPELQQAMAESEASQQSEAPMPQGGVSSQPQQEVV